MSITLNRAASDQIDEWGEKGVTETCREAREDRGYVQGMLGADKWHRGYVQGTAKGEGEVQGMAGMERGFSRGQWIPKTVVVA